MSETDDDAGDDPGLPAPPKAKSSKLTTILLLLNLGGTGYVAFTAFQGMGQAAASPAGDGEKAEPKVAEVGPVTPLEPFVVNLNEPEASRYLKATFEIEVKDASVVAELEKLRRPVRDDVLRYLSGLSVAETQGEKGKTKIQEEVVARIDKQLGGGKVRRLFFVEFVVQ